MARLCRRKEAALIYLGQSLRRFEDHRLLTGQSRFVDDITLPGMLHAVVLRSPHAHAAITSIDVAAARHATGVVSVVTASDLEQVAAHIPTRRNTDADELRSPEHPVHLQRQQDQSVPRETSEYDTAGRWLVNFSSSCPSSLRFGCFSRAAVLC